MRGVVSKFLLLANFLTLGRKGIMSNFLTGSSTPIKRCQRDQTDSSDFF